MSTSYAGEVTIKWAEIRRITTQEPIRLYFEDGSKSIGTLHSEEDGSVIVTVEQESRAPRLHCEGAFHQSFGGNVGRGAKITGHINAGLSSSSGNSQAKKFYADTEGIVRTRDDRRRWGHAAPIPRTTAWRPNRTGWRTRSTTFLHQEMVRLRERRSGKRPVQGHQLAQHGGPGERLTSFSKQPKTNLSLEGGLTYVHTDFIFAPTESYPAARWAMNSITCCSIPGSSFSTPTKPS
jgi:hypothetical protein